MILFFMTFMQPVHAQENDPSVVNTFNRIAGDSVEDSFDWTGGIDILDILECTVEVDAGFFVGASFPIVLRVEHPNILNLDSEFTTSYNAEGQPGGRIGVEAHAGLKITITLTVPIIGTVLATWNLIDETKQLDLLAEFTTPIGEEKSFSLDKKINIAKLPLYFEVLGLTILDTEINAYLGATANVKVNGTLSSEIDLRGNSLENEYNGFLLWDEQNKTLTIASETTASARNSVAIELTNPRLTLTTYQISFTSFYLEFQLTNLLPLRLAIPLPENLLSVVVSGLILGLEEIGTISIPVNVSEASTEWVVPVMAVAFGGTISLIVLVLMTKKR